MDFLKTFNWVDGIVIIVFVFSACEGYALGGVVAFFDLLKFVLSFLAGLKLYFLPANFLITFFHMPKGYASAVGFFLVACVIEITLQVSLRKVIKNVNTKSPLRQEEIGRLSNFLGIIPGALSGVILLMFLFTVMVALPLSTYLKNSLTSSHLGNFLVIRSQVVERELATIFGGAASDSLNFLTVEPTSNANVPLDFQTKNPTVDSKEEEQMLIDVNNERAKNNQQPLSVDPGLQALAREYGAYMLTHGYFSHYTPDGLSPFDRMSQKGIVFTYAGENLAFSGSVPLAMQGLMQSPGHRANILSPNFKRIGIGVMSAGVYGQMYVQEFTD